MLYFQTTLPLLSIFLPLSALTQAHMSLKSPPSLGYLGNPHATNFDYDLKTPISGAQYPCKGYHLEPSQGANQPVTSWAAGSLQSFELEGSAIHDGRSCQTSLSYDNGATFKVISSYIGGCPAAGNAPFVFKAPVEAQSGRALFAWTWFNKTGNREMYMVGVCPQLFWMDVLMRGVRVVRWWRSLVAGKRG